MLARIVIADDHAFTADGMRQTIEACPEFEVCGVAANGIEAIAQIKKFRPDCAVLDLAMPGANGFEVFAEARRWSPKTRFVIITGSATASGFQQLIDAGIDGLFLKSAPPQEIIDGIRSVVHGERVLSPDACNIIDRAAVRENLTTRELEVLHAIARGQSNAQTAEKLGVSPKTIDSHRTSLMRKMDVHSTAALLVRAMRNGLIDPMDAV